MNLLTGAAYTQLPSTICMSSTYLYDDIYLDPNKFIVNQLFSCGDVFIDGNSICASTINKLCWKDEIRKNLSMSKLKWVSNPILTFDNVWITYSK